MNKVSFQYHHTQMDGATRAGSWKIGKSRSTTCKRYREALGLHGIFTPGARKL